MRRQSPAGTHPMLQLLRPARWLLLIAVASLAWAEGALAAGSQKRVLVLHSNRRDALIALLTDSELPRLVEAGLTERVDYYSEYIDLPRFSDASYEAAFSEFLRLKYKGMRLDVVVAIQDAAISFVNQNRRRLFPGTPLVFLANDAPPAVPNSTGVIVERNFDGS